jgi:hypothetical protein
MMREDMDDEDDDRYRAKIRTISSKTSIILSEKTQKL